MALSIPISKEGIRPESFTWKELILLFVLSLMQFTFIVDYLLMMPLGPELINTLKISPKKFSALISLYTFSAAISGFLASFFIDRFERKMTILICYAGFCLGPILCSFSSDYSTLLLARVCSGAFGGVLTALIMTIIGDTIDTSKIGRATSYVLSANAIASVIGIPAALYLVDHGSWKTPFHALLPLSALVCGGGLFFIPRLKKHMKEESSEKMPSKKLLEFINNRSFIWPLMFMSLLTLAGGFTILPFLSTVVSHNYQFSSANISLLFFLGGLASFLSGPLVGNLSDRFGKQNVFLWMNFLSIMPILLLTVIPLTGKIVVLAVCTFFFMLSTARYVSGMALINSRFDPKIRGRFISLNSSIQLFSGSLGTIVTGYLLYEEGGVIFNFDIIGIVAIAATIICIFIAFMVDDE